MNSINDWRDSRRTNRAKVLFMYKNNLRTDCTFLVGEGPQKKAFKAHTFILVLVSAVFEAMFFSDVGEDKDNICIPDIDPSVFQIFLNAIYFEKVTPKSFGEACDLLYVASKYMVRTVQDQCLSYIAKNITPSNAVTGYEVLSLFGHTKLASYCWKVIQEDTAEVLTSEDFTDVRKETLMRILGEDKLAVESEGELASAVQRWVDADLQRQGLTEETDKLALLSEFLPYIRFISMSVEEFLSFPACKMIFSWADNDSILKRIGDPESTARLPPNVCSKKRVFLPKKRVFLPKKKVSLPLPQVSLPLSPVSLPLPQVSLPLPQVPQPGDWKEQLERAAERGDVDELRRLQADGADVTVRCDLSYTLLHCAAGKGRAECVRWLLEQGLSLHSITDGGMTPLHWAACYGRLETVQLLLDSGADPAVRDVWGKTALNYATSRRHSAVANLLRRRT